MKKSREELLSGIVEMVGTPRPVMVDRKFTKRELFRIFGYLAQHIALVAELRDRVRKLERSHSADR